MFVPNFKELSWQLFADIFRGSSAFECIHSNCCSTLAFSGVLGVVVLAGLGTWVVHDMGNTLGIRQQGISICNPD